MSVFRPSLSGLHSESGIGSMGEAGTSSATGGELVVSDASGAGSISSGSISILAGAPKSPVSMNICKCQVLFLVLFLV